MTLGIGPLLAEISSTAETSAVGRLLPFVLLLLGILVVAAVVLGLKHQGKDEREEDREN